MPDDNVADSQRLSSGLDLDLEFPANLDCQLPGVEGPLTPTMLDGPGIALDNGVLLNGLIHVRAASIVGDLHRVEGTRRQDAYALRFDPIHKRIHAAVSDGVGSCSRSNEGAALLSSEAVRFALEGETNPSLAAAERVRQLSSGGNQAPIDYSATLVLLSIDIGQAEEPWLVRLTQYGDGGIRVLDSNRTWKAIPETNPEFTVDNFSLPLATAPSFEKTFYWAPGTVLFITTDGLTPHLVDEAKIGHYLANRWQEVPRVLSFLNDLSFRLHGANDDRTLVGLWRTK